MTKKNNRETLLSVFDRVEDGVCITDKNGTICYLNKAAAAFTGKDDSFVGKKESDLLGSPAVGDMCADQRESVTFTKETGDGRRLSVCSYPLKTQEKGETFILSFLREKASGSADDDENALLTYKGSSMSHVFHLATKFAKIESPVLISGESGTGKVMLARYIHGNSPRRDGAFVSLNCAAIPGDLLEEEFFGKAGKDGETEKPGMLAMAAGGTLLLDEIDALPLFIQTRLLYTFHEKVYHSVGGRKVVPVDCRIIMATDRNLQQMAAEGTFREDLFYMIGVFEVSIPPIRERTMDILPLIRHLAQRYNRRYGLRRLLTDGALAVLSTYTWPGNIREMDNTMERLIVMAPEDVIDVYHLPDHIRFQAVAAGGGQKERSSLDDAVAEVERAIISRAYKEHGSSYEVARVLKISQSKASRLIRKYCSGERNKK